MLTATAAADSVVAAPARLASVRVRAGLSALVIWAIAFGITTRTTLWDRDEPRFARAAVEMSRSGDWVVPRFEGVPRTAKPPFAYWLMATAVRVLGPTELAVRLWSPIALALAALWTWSIACRLRSPEVGLRAMWMLGLAPLVLLEGTAATTDAILLAAITGSLAAGIALIEAPRSRGALFGLVAGLTAGQLTKGPVGVIVPVLILAIIAGRHVGRSHAREAFVRLALATTVSVGIFTVWLAFAARATEGRFLDEFIGREVVGRAISARDGHAVPWLAAPLYYPIVLVLGFLPWSFYLPAALRRALDAWRQGGRWATFTLATLLVPVALFTLAATKLPHYVLPAFPAMAILCASSSLSGGAGAVDARAASTRFTRLLATVLVLVLVAALALPIAERWKPIPAAARAANQVCPPGCEISLAGIEEPSLIFYLDRPTLPRLTTPAAVESWLGRGGPGVIVASREVWDAVPASARESARPLAAVNGFDVVHGGELSLVVVSRVRR